MSKLEIIKKLRELDPSISAIPLGLLRQITDPFIIIQGGSIDFVNPRIYHAVVDEIAKDYREYFLAILPLLTEWAVPTQEVSEEEIGISIDKNKEVYTAIAYMVGEVGRYGLADVRAIIETWAANKYGRVAKNAAVALQVIASEASRTQEVLSLIKDMSRDYESENSQQRRWTAASALWRIGKLRTAYDYSDFILRNLDRLAKDPSDYVASSVAYAVNALSSIFKYEQLLPIIVRLSKSKDYRTKKVVCSALDNFMTKNEQGVLDLLEDWANSESTNSFKTCVYYLLLAQNISQQDWLNLIIKAIERRPNVFAQALIELLATPEEAHSIISTLRNMSRENLEKMLPEFIDVIARLEIEEPSLNLLGTLRQVAQSESDKTFAKIVESIENKYRLHRNAEFANRFTNLINSDDKRISEYIREGVSDEYVRDFIAEIVESILMSEEYSAKIKNVWIDFATSSPVEYQKLKEAILSTRKPGKEYSAMDHLFTETDSRLQFFIQSHIETMIASKAIDIYDYLVSSCEDISLFHRVITACEFVMAESHQMEALKEIFINLARRDFLAYNKLHTTFYSAAGSDFVSSHQEMHKLFLGVDQDLGRYFENYISQNKEGYLAIAQLDNSPMRSYIISALRSLSKNNTTRDQLISIFVDRALSSFPSIDQGLWQSLERNDSELSVILLPEYQLIFKKKLIEIKQRRLSESGNQAFNIITQSGGDLETTVLALESFDETQLRTLVDNLADFLLRSPANRLSFETFASKHPEATIRNLSSSVRSKLFDKVSSIYDEKEELLKKDENKFLSWLSYDMTTYNYKTNYQNVYVFELLIKQKHFSEMIKRILLNEIINRKSLNTRLLRLANESPLFSEFLQDIYKDVITRLENKRGLPYYSLLELDSNLFAEIFVMLTLSQDDENKKVAIMALKSLANWQVLQNADKLFNKLRTGLADFEKEDYSKRKEYITQFKEILKNISIYYPEIGVIPMYSKVFEKAGGRY